MKIIDPSTRQFRAFDGHGGLHVEELSIAVGSLLRELSVVHIQFNRLRSGAIHKCDQSRSVKPNLLDDGIGRYVGISRRGNRAARDPRPRHQGMMDARLRSGASSVDGVMAIWLGAN